MSHMQSWKHRTNQKQIGMKLGNSKSLRKFLELGTTDLTDYLTHVYYCGTHYIRSLMCSQASTKYKFCSILKIEEEIDVMEMQWGEGGCSGVHQADKVRL